MDPFAKVAIGDAVRFQAQTWNAMLDAAKANLASRHAIAVPPLTSTVSSTIIRIKNETGDNLTRGTVLGLDGPIFTPADTSEDIFWREIAFRGITPDETQHKRRYAVLIEAALGDSSAYGYDSGGQIVRACFAGICRVKVDVQDTSHDYANIVDSDYTHLKSSRFGHARILWREGEGPYGHEPGTGYGYDTGIQWAVVMLGVTGSCFAIGKANGPITARSGSTFGQGQVDLYRSTTGSYSDPSEDGPVETVDVLNAAANSGSGGSVSGSIASGLMVAVAWDADDVAWVSPLECPS